MKTRILYASGMVILALLLALGGAARPLTMLAEDATPADTSTPTETPTDDPALEPELVLLQSQGQNGTTLSADVTVTGHWTRTFTWDIDKDVSPDTWRLFRGDTGTSAYTVTLTKDSGADEAWVEGEISVHNGGDVATEGLAITAVLKDGYEPPNDLLTSAEVDVSGNPVLDPGETGVYTYRIEIPITGGDFPQPHACHTYKATADVTILNHSGYLGEPFGPSPSDTTDFPCEPTEINGSVHVTDTNGGEWEFSASGSEGYTKTFGCDGDEGDNPNTATIVETDQSDTVTVTVECYALGVDKDAHPFFTRTYDWDIDKAADHSSLTLDPGLYHTVEYTVTATMTGYTDSDRGVAGTITITNPAPMDAEIVDLQDKVTPNIVATITDWDGEPFTVAAGEHRTFHYTADLPTLDPRTNVVTATLQNHDYDPELNATESGTTDFTRSRGFAFGGPTTEIHECISVTDTYAGDLGTVCVGDSPWQHTYSREIGGYEVCGTYYVTNTASFVATDDPDYTGSDDATVTVVVPCPSCVLTPGYWKTHTEEYGPAAHPDDAWDLLCVSYDTTHGAWVPGTGTSCGPDALFFKSGLSYYRVLWTQPAGNVYYILARAYIGALLNKLNGASMPSDVQTAFNQATCKFKTYAPSQVASLKGQSGVTLRNQFTSLAAILDAWNNGLKGTPHCDE